MKRSKSDLAEALLRVVPETSQDERLEHAVSENRLVLGDPPAHFDEERSATWLYLANIVARSIKLHPADVLLFELFCDTYQSYREIDQELRETGCHYSTSSNHMANMVRKHPLFGMRRDVEKAVLQYGEEFGLTPSSREKLKLPLVEATDSAEDFFRR
ncbi:MAG: phage terminase small subunit P27 family [Henriciella sp.]